MHDLMRLVSLKIELFLSSSTMHLGSYFEENGVLFVLNLVFLGIEKKISFFHEETLKFIIFS